MSPPPHRKVRRWLWSVIAGLSVICGLLVAVHGLNGPRMTAFSVDETAVVSESNSRLVLSTNRELEEVLPEQVTVAPQSPVSVQTSADSIVVSFVEPLASNTDYTVSVRGVTGLSGDRSSRFDVRFHTGESALYYLSRDPVLPDRILRTTIGSPETETAFSAPRISEFITLEDQFIVVVLDEDGNSTLQRVDKDGRVVPLTVPGRGAITDLEAVTTENLVGFRFDSAADVPGPRYQDALFLLDLGIGVADPVRGGDDEPLPVTRWAFLGRSPDLVVELADRTLLTLNARTNVDRTAVPVPLGRSAQLTAVSPDGSRVALATQGGHFLLDLSSGVQDAIAPPDAVGIADTDVLRFLAGGEGFVQLRADPDSGRVPQRIVLQEGADSRVVYEPASASEAIIGFSLSPNDEYLAVQIVPNRDEQTPDDYPHSGQAREAMTLFVNMATGQIRRSVIGFDVAW